MKWVHGGLGTVKAQRWESFEIAGTPYLAVANRNSDRDTYGTYTGYNWAHDQYTEDNGSSSGRALYYPVSAQSPVPADIQRRWTAEAGGWPAETSITNRQPPQPTPCGNG